MLITFLSADKPIVKRYELDAQGHLIKHSYPFVYEVTSYQEQPQSLFELQALMTQHAAQGHCMLKGQLSRPLVSESRKGSTDPDEYTSWICLDLDGIENYQSVDAFLDDIGCGNTDYVIQWSSSMGIENKLGFRCHIFMELDRPTHPQVLKNWLTQINLDTPTIAAQLDLTKTNNSLRWPLDITTCQNDKLLYIAPPSLGAGIVDPFATQDRISFVKKANPKLTLPFPIFDRDTIRDRSDAKISELRTKKGLKKRPSTKYKYAGSVEYMANPTQAQVTGVKTERGFTYLNLNFGDSWAYYHPEDNCTFVYNFKGEPTYRTEDLLPEYWAKQQQRAAEFQPNSQGLIYLAFRDFRTSNYFNGYYDVSADHLVLAQAKSESQLTDFLGQHGQPVPKFIPDWNLVWEPTSSVVVDPVAKTVNTYQATQLLPSKTVPSSVPPTILKVIDHVLGHDQGTIDHFLNWLAVAIQTLGRTGTAWVWQGTQGTGKGVLYHQILTPLFGAENVTAKRMEELESEFTGFMENKHVVFIDEIEAGRSLYHSRVTAKLKNLIVEPMISIRKMYTPAYMAPNYSNMVFASNRPAAVEISPDDRRFNVGPYQEKPIQLTSTEVDDLIPKELPDFLAYLKAYPANPDIARKPLVSTARSTLIHISRTAIDVALDALNNGDMSFFWDHLVSATESMGALQNIRYQPYRDLVVSMVTNPPQTLSREDMFTLLDWTVGDIPKSPHKLTSLLKHHRVPLVQVWKGGRNLRGVHVTWRIDPAWHQTALSEISTGLV